MNEQELGRDIKRTLDAGLTQLDRDVATRLAAARQTALSRTPSPGGGIAALALPRQHPWLMALLLGAGLLLAAWLGLQPRPEEDNGEMDILLLTDDIPPQAFADWRLVHREDVGPLCFANY